jgi:hypothetical protein
MRDLSFVSSLIESSVTEEAEERQSKTLARQVLKVKDLFVAGVSKTRKKHIEGQSIRPYEALAQGL